MEYQVGTSLGKKVIEYQVEISLGGKGYKISGWNQFGEKRL